MVNLAEAGAAVGPSVAAPLRAPGPKGLPLLGNLLDIGRDTLGSFEKWGAEYGEAVSLNMAGLKVLLLNDSDLVEQVLLKSPEKFIKNKFLREYMKAAFGLGLFTSEGAFWQQQRRLSAPAFATKRLESYAPVMVEMAARTAETWPVNAPFDIHPQMIKLALRIASKTLFNTEIDADVAQIEEAAHLVLGEINARFTSPLHIPDSIPTPGNRRYLKGIGMIDAVINRIIAERRAAGEADQGDLMSMLMAARDENGQPMSDQQLRDEVFTLLMAGYETSALTMSWTLMLLSEHPEIQAQVQAELDAKLGGRPLQYADLTQLPVTETVVIEAMRLYPAAWGIGREAVEDTNVGRYAVSKGTTVFILPWLMHRNPRWFPEPLAFRPERWQGDLRRTLPRFAYMPFGGGQRICIGMRFAMMEMMLLLGTILQRVTLTRTPGHAVRPFPSISLRPDPGVMVEAAWR